MLIGFDLIVGGMSDYISERDKELNQNGGWVRLRVGFNRTGNFTSKAVIGFFARRVRPVGLRHKRLLRQKSILLEWKSVVISSGLLLHRPTPDVPTVRLA